MTKTISLTIGALFLVSGLLSGCTLLTFGAVAVGESRRANSPEVRAEKEAATQRKWTELAVIKQAYENGNEYAEIELARKCYETDYPCVVEGPVSIFKKYSDRGYEIATYYYASFKLGLDPWGYHITNCEKTLLGQSKCVDKKTGSELMAGLSQNGCEYEVQAYQRRQWIYPCSRLKKAERPF